MLPEHYEVRFNKYHGKDGKFASKNGGAGGGDPHYMKWEKTEFEDDGGFGHIRQWVASDPKIGTQHTITDIGGSGFSTEEIENTIIPTFNRLQSTNPIKGWVDLRLEKKLDHLPGDDSLGHVGGRTRLGTGSIQLSGKFAGRTVDDIDVPFNTPAARGHLWSEYLLTHEWGHALDQSKSTARGYFGRGKPDIDYKPNEYGKRSLHMFNTETAFSEYGHTNPMESYAEQFAEFRLSGGKTRYVGAQMYAKEFGWTA